MNQCRDCLWWKRLTDDQGECHAGHPSPVVRAANVYGTDLLQVLWPPTASNDGCGDWTPPPVRDVK